jgi:predicted ATP-grasp superfamily ATP-dependent carboligase
MNQPETVLLTGNFRQTIAVVRSLARAGHRVVIGRDQERAFTEFSRFTSAVWPCESADRDRFYARVGEFIQACDRKPILFPVGEFSLERFAVAQERFDAVSTVVMPGREVVERCLDKTALNELALSLGVRLPPTAPFVSRADWEARAREFGYPCVIKRKSSFTLVEGKKALILENEQALARYLGSDDAAIEPESLILQKYVRGRRHNCHFAAVDGEVIAYFEQKVLRTDAWDGTGYGVEGVSVEPTAEMQRWTEMLARKLGYTGVGCTQFLVDQDEDLGFFLELNPRLDATCALPGYSGYDFPLLAVECAQYRNGNGIRPVAPRSDYPAGVRVHWLLGDLLGWMHAVHHREITPREAIRWLRCTVRAFFSHRRHLTWSWSDPLPTLVLYRQHAGEVFRNLFGGFARELRRRFRPAETA